MMDTTSESLQSTTISTIMSQSTGVIQRAEQPDLKHIKFITVPPIVTPNPRQRFRRKSNASPRKITARPTGKSPRNKITRPRRSSKSPSKKVTTSNIVGTKVFMEPPTRKKSGTRDSVYSQYTKHTNATDTRSSKFTRASTRATQGTQKTKTSYQLPSLIAPAPTRSYGSHLTLGISKNSGVLSGSVHNSRDTILSLKTLESRKLKPRHSQDSGVWMTRAMKDQRTPTKITEMPLKATEPTEGTGEKRKSKGKKSRSRATSQVSRASKKSAKSKKEDENPSTAEARSSRGSKKSDGNKESGAGKKTKKDKTATPSTTTATDTRSSKASKKSKKSKGSKSGKGKKAKKGKEKVKKLNRKVIYKDMKAVEKRMEEEARNRQKMEWEKNKLFFYWNSVVSRLLDLQRRNHGLKKKEASLKMEKKNGMFHQNWKTMNLARLQREECLDAKRAEFRSMIRELRDSHKRQTDWLFKDIQTYVKDTYLVGQKYVNDVVGIRMEYTKGLTDTMFEARENLRVLEIEQNAKYGPALEEFEEQMRKLRSRIPLERQERLNEMLTKSHGMLVELVNVYTTILHHNYIEVCHTANIINELKTVERRLEREMTDMVRKRDKIKERTEYLNDRVSNLRRQVNAGKEARKKLHRVLKEQEVLQGKIDLAYIGKEITFQENSRLKTALKEMSERVDNWYFKVKKDLVKDIILQTAKHEERASQLKNYNHLIKYLFNEEQEFLEDIANFKDHEEFDDPKEGLKVLLGVFRPHTLYDLERDFEGCTESFTTAIIFFKRRLQQHYMSLDDLHFFIRRRSPLSYLNKVIKEEMALKQLMSFIFGSVYGHVRSGDLTLQSSHSFKL